MSRRWGGVAGLKGVKVLDVGCGIGGTTRYMAQLLPDSEITGITLSPEQAGRGAAFHPRGETAAARRAPRKRL